MLIIAVLGVTGLLAVLGTLSRGRLQIDNVCDIGRKDRPVTFFLIIIAAVVVFGAMVALPGAGMWAMLSYGQD